MDYDLCDFFDEHDVLLRRREVLEVLSPKAIPNTEENWPGLLCGVGIHEDSIANRVNQLEAEIIVAIKRPGPDSQSKGRSIEYF